MLYAAKCYWPGATPDDLEQVAERAGRAGLAADSAGVVYLGSLLFAADDLVLCLFRGDSRAPPSSGSATGSASRANASWTRYWIGQDTLKGPQS